MTLKVTKTMDNDFILTKELLVALLVLVVTVVLFVLWKKSRKTNRDVLLVGLCDSGKTTLFSYLLYNKHIQSYTSQMENVGEYQSRRKTLRLVDIPGHERVFQKYWDSYKIGCKGIMFVVDSDTVQTNICDVAELLYRILTDEAVQSNKCRIIILCNKQDIFLCKRSKDIKTLLEKELDTLRLTKASQLESIDGKKNKAILGKKKKHFEFSHCPNPVDFTEVAAAYDDVVIHPIKYWLDVIS